MKSFLEKIIEEKGDSKSEGPLRSEPESFSDDSEYTAPPARIAVYDSLSSPPRVVELQANKYEEFINLLATKTYRFSQEKRGTVPFTVIKETIENLIHACFLGVTITVLDNGNTIRISDQGPGIKSKEKALEPGFSTATREMKKIIKGVGSGLPIAGEVLACAGGTLKIENNLEEGTVVTLSIPEKAQTEDANNNETARDEAVLSTRQKQVLFLVTELGSTGPSEVANELGISLSSAYRDLLYLESHNLIKASGQGKRSLTAQGVEYLDVAIDK